MALTWETMLTQIVNHKSSKVSYSPIVLSAPIVCDHPSNHLSVTRSAFWSHGNCIASYCCSRNFSAKYSDTLTAVRRGLSTKYLNMSDRYSTLLFFDYLPASLQLNHSYHPLVVIHNLTSLLLFQVAFSFCRLKAWVPPRRKKPPHYV